MTPLRFPAPMADVFTYATWEDMGGMYGCCVITLSGRLDESRFRRALRLAIDAEPIVGCRFVPRWFRPYWERRTDLDSLDFFRVIEGSQDSPQFADFVSTSIDAAREPLVQGMLLRGPKDALCIKASHVVGDGPAFGRFIPQVVDIYRQLKRNPSYVPKTNLNTDRTMRSLAEQLSPTQRIRILANVLFKRTPPLLTWVFPRLSDGERFRGYLWLTLPSQRGKMLSRYGRSRKATMTSVVLAATYRAARKVFRLANDDVATFFTTTDLRRFFPKDHPDTGMSNIATAGIFVLDPRLDTDFEATLDSVRKQLKAILKDRTHIGNRMTAFFLAVPSLRFVLRFAPLSMIKHRLEKYTKRLAARRERRWGLTNGGVVDASSVDFQDVGVEEIYFYGGIIDWPTIAIIFTAFRDAITISLPVSPKVIDAAVARQLLEEIDKELPFHGSDPGEISMLSVPTRPGGNLPWSDLNTPA